MLGAAIGLNLLFHIPLLAGVLITAADTLLLLWFQRFGIRTIEAFVLALITMIAGCFVDRDLLGQARRSANWSTGLVPRLNGDSLYVAIGILGATVMPHNLYLHSALVQTRQIGHDGRGQADGLPLQPHRFGGGAERGALCERGDPGDGGGGVLQARHRGDRNPAGAPAAGAAAGDRRGERAVRDRAALLRAVFHAHRDAGRADRDGGLSATSACGRGCGG